MKVFIYIDIEIQNEYHDNVVKFIFHIGELQEIYEEELARDVKTQEFSDEAARDDIATEAKSSIIAEGLTQIDFPEKLKENKERNGCSRLCSTSKCFIF